MLVQLDRRGDSDISLGAWSTGTEEAHEALCAWRFVFGVI